MEAVNNTIKDLIIELQSLAHISGFGLAGGTNLALRLNHRVSDDIDYSSLPKRPSHSNDRLLLLPSSKKWAVARTSWKRKVRDLMRNKGIEPPKIKPIN